MSQYRKLPGLLIAIILLQFNVSFCQNIPIPYTGPVSYVRTWDALAPVPDGNVLIGKDYQDVRMTTQYADGLGRPVQQVVKKGSKATNSPATDLVVPVVYDAFGRQKYQYLPYADAGTNGLFKPNPFTTQASFYNTLLSGQATETNVGPNQLNWAYSKTNFEASPLNRVLESYAPGVNWVGSEGTSTPHPVSMKYWINTATDNVKIWKCSNAAVGSWVTYTVDLSNTGGVYAAGTLYKQVNADETGKQVIEFKDKSGKVILKKVQLTALPDDGTGQGYEGWLNTYYIYDDLDNLRCVIQPEAVKAMAEPSPGNWVLTTTMLNEQCFRYEYDHRNRMIMKKVPGSGHIDMIYDARDRLVMTQDAIQRSYLPPQWSYTQYDLLNRPVSTGVFDWDTDAQNFRNYANLFINYPWDHFVSSGIVPEVLTVTHYDEYNGLPAGLSAYVNAWNNATYFSTTNNSTWPYPQMPEVSLATKGMVTWAQVKVLGTSNFLNTVTYYDAKGRPIQVQSTNLTGGTDISTTQYSWAGQALVIISKHQKGQTNPLEDLVITKMQYDDLGRLINVKKKVIATINSIEQTSSEVEIVKNEYDQLGQLKTKYVGKKKDDNGNYSTNEIEKLIYDYNIRGWLLGMNRDYLTGNGQTGTNRFGFELGYDKSTNKAGRNFLSTGMYNGNINGMVWKSDGDDVKRIYDFNYDAANRLMKADFVQDNGNGTWNKTSMDYTMLMGNGTDPALAYDANGNIKSMKQFGWKISSPAALIDNLFYTYFAGSNRLQAVTDAVLVDNKMGDFTDKNTTATDYGYDKNGNLVTDLNKRLNGSTGSDLSSGGAITYNYLNLPQSIAVKKDDGTTKGTIVYTYDAAGNKLKKEVTEEGLPTKTTLYLSGHVYENDMLQFIGMEEGRVRPVFNWLNQLQSFAFDYMLTDHLGNVRMVLTDEQQTDPYPAATMETAQTATEELLYANINTTRIDKPVAYPVDNTTNPNAKVAKVSAAVGMQKIGPSITLKVMAGDAFNLKVSSWYKTNGTSPAPPQGPLPDLLASLINGVSRASGGKVATTQLQSSGVLIPGATEFLKTQTIVAGRPKAYLNWILFDEQLNFVSSNSGFEQVPAETTYGTIPNQIVYQHVKNNLISDKCGYLYVYVSNETPNIDVFFDNLQVTHIRGPILEETHYYPFGLTMAGISSKAAGSLENKRKWNKGSELESKEFSDGSGLELYSTFYRSLDPQLGRFWQIDPKPNYMESPYAAMGNNPISYNDPLGDTLLTKADHRRAARIEKQINKTNASLNKQVTKLNGQIAAADAKGNTSKADGLRAKLGDVNSRISTNTNTLSNLNGIRNDQTQGYTFNQLPTGSPSGFTELKTMSVNGNNQNVVVMNVLSDVNAVHELTHAYQGGISHLISFILNQQSVSFPGANLFAQQMTNAVSENQAYQAQYALDPSSMPPSTGGYVPNHMNSINAFYVGGINQPGTTTPVYPNVQNMVNTIMQLLRVF